MNAKTATIAMTAAGVAISATPADAATQATTTQASHKHDHETDLSEALTTASAKVRSYKSNAPTSTAARVRAYYKSLSPSQRVRIYRSYTHYRLYHSRSGSYRSYLKHHAHFGHSRSGLLSASNTQARAARIRLLSIMRRYEGIMYRYGGTTPSGFDCSGFTRYVYRQIGYTLPRTSGAQRYAGHAVSRSQGRPGDLVWMPGHVGIYLGNGMMFDSPRTGKAIGARKIWRSNYRIVRVIND